MESEDSMFSRIAFLVIIGAALLTRLWNISDPPRAMFDEVYYATMANFYISGTPFVDTHPPVGRLIFALAALLGGSDGTAQFLTPGTLYGSFPYIWLRAASGIAGVICIALLMLLTRAITSSPRAGLIAGVLGLLENAFAAQSRVILPDMFLLMFGLLGLLLALRGMNASSNSHARHLWLASAGIALGLALGVKISGVIFIAAAFILSLARQERRPSHPQLLAYLLILPFATLYLLTLLHFVLLDARAPVISSIGTNQDTRYATMFNALRDPAATDTSSLILQRIKETTFAFIALPTPHLRPFHPHPAASPWFSWPLMYRPMLYDYTSDEHASRVFALFGNPAVWWGGLIALVALLFRAARGAINLRGIIPLTLSYAFALLFFAVASRELFLYLYFPALAFLVIILAAALNALVKHSKGAFAFALGLIVFTFLFFAPYTYGLPLSEHAFALRAWLPSWDFSEQK